MVAILLAVILDPNGKGDVYTTILRCKKQGWRGGLALSTTYLNTPMLRITLEQVAAHSRRDGHTAAREDELWDLLMPVSAILAHNVMSNNFTLYTNIAYGSHIENNISDMAVDEVGRKSVGIIRHYLDTESHSFLILPINKSDELVGMFVAQSLRKNAFTEAQLNEINNYLRVAALQLRN